MVRVNTVLTRYLIKKGYIKEEENEVYEYGFTLLFEKSLSIFICFCIAYKMNMLREAVLFCMIVGPLRSYAGGLHLESFLQCLFLSCFSFTAILTIVKYVDMKMTFSILCSFFMSIIIYKMYPVENRNREVDNEENKIFRKKLCIFLLIDLLLALLMFFLKKKDFLFLISLTLIFISLTMFLGKLKYNREILRQGFE